MNDLTFSLLLKKLEGKLSILPDKSEETTQNTLKALWLMAAGFPVSVLKAESSELPDLSAKDIITLEGLIAKRISGVPIAHLTGRQSFMGMEMLAGQEALIPRKETELLGYTAIQILNDQIDQQPVVVDVCTGAGNIALAIAKSVPNVRVVATDLSADAVRLAESNATHLNLSSLVSFYCGDLLAPIEALGLHGKVNLITCNPPYISTSKVSEMPEEISSFEPGLAFDGGAFGINLIRKLVAEASYYLANKGHLVFEVGEGQGQMIKKLVEKFDAYSSVQTISDSQDKPRVIVAQKI